MKTLPWKLGFNTFWWTGLERESAARACADALVEIGYEAVEFKVDSFGPHPAKNAIVQGCHIAREAGLAVSNLVILRGFTNENAPKAVADTIEAIRICAAAGVEKLNFVSGGPKQQQAYPEDEWWQVPTHVDPASWDNLQRSLEALLKVAEAEKVDLVLEACQGHLVEDLGTSLEVLARCDHPRMNFTFDPSHYVLQGLDIGVAIRRLGSRIKHVHFKDAVGRKGPMGTSFLFPFLGEGATDWPVFFGALKDIGYKGIISVEFESFRFMDLVYHNDPVPPARLSKLALREQSSESRSDRPGKRRRQPSSRLRQVRGGQGRLRSGPDGGRAGEGRPGSPGHQDVPRLPDDAGAEGPGPGGGGHAASPPSAERDRFAASGQARVLREAAGDERG
jgi:sugar phosphate isomerase/epimerase